MEEATQLYSAIDCPPDTFPQGIRADGSHLKCSTLDGREVEPILHRPNPVDGLPYLIITLIIGIAGFVAVWKSLGRSAS